MNDTLYPVRGYNGRLLHLATAEKPEMMAVAGPAQTVCGLTLESPLLYDGDFGLTLCKKCGDRPAFEAVWARQRQEEAAAEARRRAIQDEAQAARAKMQAARQRLADGLRYALHDTLADAGQAADFLDRKDNPAAVRLEYNITDGDGLVFKVEIVIR